MVPVDRPGEEDSHEDDARRGSVLLFVPAPLIRRTSIDEAAPADAPQGGEQIIAAQAAAAGGGTGDNGHAMEGGGGTEAHRRRPEAYNDHDDDHEGDMRTFGRSKESIIKLAGDNIEALAKKEADKKALTKFLLLHGEYFTLSSGIILRDENLLLLFHPA